MADISTPDLGEGSKQGREVTCPKCHTKYIRTKTRNGYCPPCDSRIVSDIQKRARRAYKYCIANGIDFEAQS